MISAYTKKSTSYNYKQCLSKTVSCSSGWRSFRYVFSPWLQRGITGKWFTTVEEDGAGIKGGGPLYTLFFCPLASWCLVSVLIGSRQLIGSHARMPCWRLVSHNVHIESLLQDPMNHNDTRTLYIMIS